MKIKYITITPKGLKKYQVGLLELLDKEKKRPSEIMKSLNNSSYIIIAMDWEKVVGSNQIITDKYFVTYFINLLVNPDYRSYWIGAKIIEKTISQAKKINTKFIQLTPDPSFPWLKDFYAKYWFKENASMWMR